MGKGPGVRRWAARSPWPLVLALALAALAATLTNDPGHYVGDNRFEFYWAPERMLAEMGSVWDGGQGLGVWRWRFWPAAAFTAALQDLGLSPALIERLWHALLLTTAGAGMVAVVRRFRPRIGLEHLVAGFLYAFSPLTATFLVPSGLFTYYALAPWFLYTMVRGTDDRRDVWRWSAIFALLVFATGNVNLPTLVFTLLPLVPAALFMIHVDERTSGRDLLRWGTRAAALTAVVLAAPLVNAVLTADTVGTIVEETETLAQTSGTSSWSESWRGLGWWKTYFEDPFRGLSYPQLSSYFASTPVVLATFAAPVAALLAVAYGRWRPRLLFASFMAGGLVLMVAAFDLEGLSGYGELLVTTAERVPNLAGFRNSYKAGALLMLGVAPLAGVAVAAAISRLQQRSTRVAGAGLVAVIGVAGLASFPFWSGQLYFPYLQMGEVPDYWEDALSWLDDQPEPGRVLILPGTVNARYTWGTPGDDLFAALLDRPHVTRSQISAFQGTAQAADLITALDHHLERERLQPGLVGPILQRLGIRYVLLRNDLDWDVIGRPSPEWFDRLRTDPGLQPAATFGTEGENVDPSDDDAAPLPPVEVFEVRGARGLATVSVEQPMLVSGDGAAWPQLSAAGLLDDTGPVRYTGDLAGEELVSALESAGRLVVTDTNRRRIAYAGTDVKMPGFSHTLTAGEELDSPPNNLFGDSEDETVVTYGDADTITASSYGDVFHAAEVWARPGNVGDDDERTAWLVGPTGDEVGESVRIELDEAQPVSRVRVEPAATEAGSVTEAVVRLSDGTTRAVDLSEGDDTAYFPEVTAAWVEVELTEVSGPVGEPVGLAEVVVDNLDFLERVRVPEDVFIDADAQAVVARIPTTYVFAASGGFGDTLEERSLHRQFRTAGERSYRLRAWVGDRSLPTGCVTGQLTVDGSDVALRASAEDGVREACTPVSLDEGAHTLVTDTGVPRVVLETAPPEAASGSAELGDASGGSTDQELTVTGEGELWVVAGQSYTPAWTASVEGRDLGEPVALNAQAGWRVTLRNQDTAEVVTVRLPVDDTYRIALATSLVALAVCVALVIRPPRRSS